MIINQNFQDKISLITGRTSGIGLARAKKLSQYDLSIDGALEFNEIYSSDPHVHYFSYSTYAT